jgi:hypothetical protein
MRAQLGNRNYYMIRAMLLQQQETFMQQVFELHRLHRTQQHLSAELNSPEYLMTAQFAKEAVAVMRSAAAGTNPSLVTGRPSPSPAAAARAPAAAAAAKNSSGGMAGGMRAAQIVKATAEEMAADDTGAAAVALLSVHMALMPQVPSVMRKLVPQPKDFRGMEPSRYQVRWDAPGVHCPIPSRFVLRNSSGAGGPAVSGDTVEAGPDGNKKSLLGKRGSPCVTSGVQPGVKRQQELVRAADAVGKVQAATAATGGQGATGVPVPKSSLGPKLPQNGSVGTLPDSAAVASAGRECGSDDVQVQLSGSGEEPEQQHEGCEEQQSKDTGGGSQLQGQVSSGAATAAAAMAGPLATAAAIMSGAAGAVAAAAAAGAAPVPPCIPPAIGAPLNVFRPNPQISPSVASRFLSGDPLHNRGFDPHSYWMKKHYGSSISGQQQQQTTPAMSQGEKEQQQKVLVVEDRASPLPADMAAAALNGVGGAQDAPAAPKVVHWWQNAEATFGEPGLIDPTKPSKLLDGVICNDHQK